MDEQNNSTMQNSEYQQGTYQQPQQNMPQQGIPQQYVPQNNQPPKGGLGLSLTSMILGLIAFSTGCCFYYITLPCGLIGFILGVISIAKKNEGKGMAVTGVVLSTLSLVAFIVMMITGISLASLGSAGSTPGSSDDDDTDSSYSASVDMPDYGSDIWFEL